MFGFHLQLRLPIAVKSECISLRESGLFDRNVLSHMDPEVAFGLGYIKLGRTLEPFVVLDLCSCWLFVVYVVEINCDVACASVSSSFQWFRPHCMESHLTRLIISTTGASADLFRQSGRDARG